MRFFFDESGKFTLPADPSRHSAAVVMGVVVSELIEERLREDFSEFTSSLSEQEKRDGEPRGWSLRLESRSRFCDLLAKYSGRGLNLTPVLLDMTSIARQPDSFCPEKMQEHIEAFAEICKYESTREAYRELAVQFGQLSVPQAWRLFAWANGFRESIEHAIIFLCSKGHENCWRDVTFEVDAVEMHRGGLEEDVFEKMVLGWLAGWSSEHRFMTIEEIHTNDNPFVKMYATEDAIDLGKLIRDRIRFVDSKANWGVQIADIASNIVYRAAHDLDNERGEMMVYASLMRSSPYGDSVGPCVLNPIQTSNRIEAELQEKYYPMYEALNRRAPLNL